jgi:hypothetical protein
MRRPVRTRSVRPPKAERQATLGSGRDLLAVLLALATVVCLGAAFFLAKDMKFLAPGPMTSAHGAIDNCNACHTKSGSGKLSWIRGLVPGDPHADSQACLTCHKMPDTAFNAHSASPEVLNRSTKRLTKIAAEIRAPHGARAQSVAFPTHDVAARGLNCATCHQEHRGANFKLSKISNEQCQSCHVVKFDSFDGHHPEFENYPFKRRTPIIYDHTSHGKHFSEVLKKDPAKRIPATCTTCHSSREDRRIMAVGPFEQTCRSCHLGQITGKERVSGPKGIAFLTLPGLDLQTLKKKSAPIGEWPAASEAELTPFMKVMISRSERGRSLIKAVDNLNLQDLTDASDDQIKAVTELVWEIKRLFYALIAGKASDVLGDLNIDCGAKLSANLVADLTASIPRDVVFSAHQQWLPNLGAEMANRQDTNDREQTCWITTIGGWVTTMTEPKLAADGEPADIAGPGGLVDANQPTETKSVPGSVAESLRVDPYGRLVRRLKDEAEGAQVKVAQPKAAQPEAAQTKGEPGKADIASAKPDDRNKTPSVNEQPQPKAAERPQAKTADQTDDLLNPTEEELRELARPGAPAVRGYTAYVRPGGGTVTLSGEQPRAVRDSINGGTRVAQATPRAADQTDDLLNPTEDELRGIAPTKDAEKAAQPDGAVRRPAPANARPDRAASADAASRADAKAPADTPTVSDAAAVQPQARAAPVIGIESDVDPESWAEYGGWYRQDYAIFYRPVGHKDKFIFSWLFLTGPQAPKGDRSPAAAVFDFLTGKDAQGSCTKCHSVDGIRGKGRLVNFSPPKIEAKMGRFTNFIHEPHFGVLENRGCLTCHNLEKGRPYLQGYEQGNPKKFVSNFGAVKKELCQTCHTSGMARQDCLLCHKYHLNGVTTPIMNTKIPIE